MSSDGVVFEIKDFTTASSFERLIRQIELIITSWGYEKLRVKYREKIDQICDAKSVSNPAIHHNECIPPPLTVSEIFGHENSEIAYRLTYCASTDRSKELHKSHVSIVKDSQIVTDPFPTRCPRLQRWFQVTEYLLLEALKSFPDGSPLTNPVSNRLADYSVAEISYDTANCLLSALTLAVKSTAIGIASFVCLSDAPYYRYIGETTDASACQSYACRNSICSTTSCGKSQVLYPFVFEEGRGCVTRYNVDCEAVPPSSSLQTLSGLSELFLAVCGVDGHKQNLIKAAVRYTFIIEDFPPPTNTVSSANCDSEDVLTIDLPDAISAIHLNCTWPHLNVTDVVDSTVCTQLHWQTAPDWSVRVFDNPQLFLPSSRRLHRLFGFKKDSIEQHEYAKCHGKGEVPALLTWLTNDSSHSTAIEKQAFDDRVIPSLHQLDTAIAECFNGTSAVSAGNDLRQDSNGTERDTIWAEIKATVGSIKGCPRNCLLADISLFCCDMHSFKGVAMLWDRAVRMLRYCWETATLVPNMGSLPDGPLGAPSGEFCLLYQKLQTLNCAIQQKNVRKRDPPNKVSHRVPLEGFSQRSFVEPVLQIWPPVTTDFVPLTQERLHRSEAFQGEQFENQKPISSAIAAFKDANSGGSVEDFVVWWNLRFQKHPATLREILSKTVDSVTVDRIKDCWQRTSATVATQQPALFNCDLEGEMALHFLENVSGPELLHQLICCFVSSNSLDFACSSHVLRIESVRSQLRNLLEQGQPEESPSVAELSSSIITQFENTERLTLKVASLFEKLGTEAAHLVNKLTSIYEIESVEVSLTTADEKKIVQKLATRCINTDDSSRPLLYTRGLSQKSGMSIEENKSPWPPYAREYLFSYTAENPTTSDSAYLAREDAIGSLGRKHMYSCESLMNGTRFNQGMYACITPEEFRVASRCTEPLL